MNFQKSAKLFLIFIVCVCFCSLHAKTYVVAYKNGRYFVEKYFVHIGSYKMRSKESGCVELIVNFDDRNNFTHFRLNEGVYKSRQSCLDGSFFDENRYLFSLVGNFGSMMDRYINFSSCQGYRMSFWSRYDQGILIVAWDNVIFVYNCDDRLNVCGSNLKKNSFQGLFIADAEFNPYSKQVVFVTSAGEVCVFDYRESNFKDCKNIHADCVTPKFMRTIKIDSIDNFNCDDDCIIFDFNPMTEEIVEEEAGDPMQDEEELEGGDDWNVWLLCGRCCNFFC